jgi:hypothetical protein
MEQLFTSEVIFSFVFIGVLALITTTIMRVRKNKAIAQKVKE